MRINEIRKKGSIESLVIALWRFAVLVKISNHNGNNKRFLFIHQKKCVKMNLPLSLYWIFGDWWTVNEQRAECVMDFFGLICVHTILIHSFAFGAKQSMAKPRKAKPIERKRNWAFCMQPNAYTVRNCLCVRVCCFLVKSTPIDQFDNKICLYHFNNYTNDLQLEHFQVDLCVIHALSTKIWIRLFAERAKFNDHNPKRFPIDLLWNWEQPKSARVDFIDLYNLMSVEWWILKQKGMPIQKV